MDVVGWAKTIRIGYVSPPSPNMGCKVFNCPADTGLYYLNLVCRNFHSLSIQREGVIKKAEVSQEDSKTGIHNIYNLKEARI